MSIATTPDVLFLGIDGGGTKCKASLADTEGRQLGSGVSGPANPFHGVERAKESIVLAAQLALKDAGLAPDTISVLVAGAGLAGVNVPSIHQIMSEWSHPFAALHLTTDLRIACLGAHKRDDGAVIIAGTGSCGYVRAGGRDCMLGGHGFPLGDQGSGAWMGLKAIKAVLLAHDELGPATLLTELLASELDVSGVAIVETMAGRTSYDYACLAPAVFMAAEQGDAVAIRIVQEGADYLSALARRLLDYHPSRLSIIGGLAERMPPWLAPPIVQQLAPPLCPPEFGAIAYARQQQKLTY